jgi:hypothetical protein
MPTFVTSQNVRFDGSSANAVVLDNTGGIRTLVLWDNLSAADQSQLTTFVNDRGGVTPLSSPTSGSIVLNYGSVTGSSSTGLSNTAAAAGFATINVGGNKAGSTASGLRGAAGYAGYQIANFDATIAGGGSSGLVSGTTYTATIVVDGVSKAISIAGANALTFAGVISELNTDLGVAATAAISGGDIKITSSTIGNSSTVSITPGTLFPALSGFLNTTPAVRGEDATVTYSAVVTVDNRYVRQVSFKGTVGDTFQHVLDEINADLGAYATASLSSGNIKITSATLSSSSSVVVSDSGALFKSLSGYTGITTTAGTSPLTYTLSLVVNGSITVDVSVLGTAVQTFTTLTSALNTALGSNATATFNAGVLTIASATTGDSSSVAIKSDSLLQYIPNYVVGTIVKGASSMLNAFKTARTASGAVFYDAYPVVAVGSKPSVPLTVKHTTAFIYYGGSPAKWRYLDDDTAV